LELNPTAWIRDGRQYLADVQTEFKKITWPSQKEWTSTTIGVLIVVALMTLLLGLADLGLAKLMELVLG
jgi:preprotein translocase subunit SecE